MRRGFLTATDEGILRAVHRYRYMTLADVHFLLFSPGIATYVRKLLLRLSGGDFAEGNFLYRFHLPDTKRGNPQRVYTLGKRGRDYCRDALGLADGWYFNPDRTDKAGFLHLQHSLALTKSLVAAEKWSGTQTVYKLTDIKTSYELAQIRRMKEAPLAIPDAWLLFQRGERKFPTILEIDLGTENINKFKEHIAARIAFIESGTYEEVFGVPSVCIAYLTLSSDHRRQSLCEWTWDALKGRGQEEWASVFLFASMTLEEIYDLVWLSDKRWAQAGTHGRDYLFGP